MIRKRKAIGRLYTPMQNFLITGYAGEHYVGTEDDDRQRDEELNVFYYPRPGVLSIKGNAVYKEFVNPRIINIFVKGEENETNGK